MTAELIVDLFVSVDGYAGSDGLPGYFGYFGPDLDAWITAEAASPQVVVLGRRTYEVLAGLPPEARDDGWDRLTALDKVVFSRTLAHADWPHTRLCVDGLVEEVRSMKETSTTPLRTMGSLSVARQLLDAGLVDRLRLLTFPLLAGPSGREPAFASLASADLELVGHSVLDGRLLLAEYRPTGHDIPRS